MIWSDMACYGVTCMEWNGMVWRGVIWYGLVFHYYCKDYVTNFYAAIGEVMCVRVHAFGPIPE